MRHFLSSVLLNSSWLVLVFPCVIRAQEVGDWVVVVVDKEAKLKSGTSAVGTVFHHPNGSFGPALIIREEYDEVRFFV